MSEIELKALRERIEVLEDILGVGQNMVQKIRTAFGLTASQARILGMMMSRQAVTKDAIYAMLYGSRPDCDLPGDKTIHVFLHKIRKALRFHGLDFATLVGEGCYTIKASDKARIREMLELVTGDAPLIAPAAMVANSDFPTIAFDNRQRAM